MECVLRSVMSEGNVAQGKAIKSICKSPKPLFITGKGGSGKTTFLKRIIPALKNAVVVAPTGVAAVNAGGQTIHSFFRIGMQPYIPEIRKGAFMDNCEYKFNGGSEKILQNIKYLIIDEISMVRPDLLDNVADILRHARGDKDPFGGVKLIMVGDLFQLPPVIKEDFFREIYDTSYFFSSKSLMASGMEMVSFEKIYRQKDEKFISILNKVREGQMDDDVFDTINSRCIQSDNNQGYVEIVTTNSKATAINEMRISSLPGSLRKLEAVINGDYPKDAPVEKTLFLKEGCYGDMVNRHVYMGTGKAPDGMTDIHDGLYGFLNQTDFILWSLKNDRSSRRIVASMFDPETNGLKPLQECAFQINLSVKGDELYMTLYQRSQDMITASYWNVAQYAALMMMFAHDAGLRPAVFTHFIQDMHVYDRHEEQANELLRRSLFGPVPQVTISSRMEGKGFYDFVADDFEVWNYEPKEQIKFEIAK